MQSECGSAEVMVVAHGDYCQHVAAAQQHRDFSLARSTAADGLERFALLPGDAATGEGRWLLRHYAVTPVLLNALVPLFDRFALDVSGEQDFTLAVGPTTIYLKSFTVSAAVSLAGQEERLIAALVACRRGFFTPDHLNRLVLLADLDWREVDLCRAYRNYLLQLPVPFAKRSIDFALVAEPQVARLLVRYFALRFAPEFGLPPEEREERLLPPLRSELAVALDQVADPHRDRILRTLFNLIDATVRTNFYRAAATEHAIALKFSDLGIIDLPAPRPVCEIFVHAPHMQGIHLRGGAVARGGIRWSDRPDDFRTEVLGLMKTQMAKNALIVPVGAKGGFIVCAAAPDKRNVAGIAAYSTLIRGLLDLTDNRVAGAVVRPSQVVAYDGDDPYLVVAADKGTAHFSDVANAIAREYGFWLGDAFASGGSHGYDHKRLAITARGAWECVRGHFAELGLDADSAPLTVVGIGDMSGDVFGNGLLRSPHLQLRGAFDHRHIFLDPAPDPQRSYAERTRLFNLPGSSWDDYDRVLISPGGGVFRRDAKEIVLSEPVQRWLGSRRAVVEPNELIRLLLTAEVDLLWNGGIGTYVKGAAEQHEQIGDRANDGVRVDGGQLRAAVVGEGGNLGFTQRGRIEYALSGGRLNTDAIDNSGGVDCSDHEVNLKIFLDQLVAAGELTHTERDRELESMAEAVCAAVLADNRAQHLALTLDAARARRDVTPFLEAAARLTNAGLLDRRQEAFPEDREVLSRSLPALTRPELAVLLAWSKMFLKQTILARGGGVSWPGMTVADYFPATLSARYGQRLAEHPLAAELLATLVANRVVNCGGAALLFAVSPQGNAEVLATARAILLLEQVLVAACGSAADALTRVQQRVDRLVHLLVVLQSAADGAEAAATRLQAVLAADMDNCDEALERWLNQESNKGKR